MFNNGAVDWVAKLVKVKLSTAEAEIAAGCMAGKRGVYVRGLIGEVYPMPRIATPHIVDNSATPALSENVGVSRKTEHFTRWLHYLRHLVSTGACYIFLCKTHQMHANALTKVENRSAFFVFRSVSLNLP